MWRIVFGLIAGVLLATLRAPEGLSLFSLPGVPAWQSYLVRAIALLAIALAALLGRNLFAAGRSNADILWALTAGFLLYSFSPDTGAGLTWTSLLVPPAIFVVFVVKWLDPRAALVDPTPPPKRAWVLRLGLFVGGVGVAITCEGLARHLLLLGAGEGGDESVFGASFLILLAFGGLAFGSFLKALEGDRAKAPAALVCLPLAALAGWLGMTALKSMSTTRDLDRFVRGLGMNTADHGMLHFDAALAAPVLVITAFLIRTALYCARRRSEFSAILGGAGAGLLLVPVLLALPAGSDLAEAAFSAQLVGIGALVSAAGSLFAALLAAGIGVPARLLLGVSALAAGWPGPWQRDTPLVILSPWELRPAVPELVFEGPEGLFTVEPSGPGFLHATLGRRQLSPDFDAAAADAQRIVRSWDVLEGRQPGQSTSVLLIGQLTPGRALALTNLGATNIDRTAAWHAAMPRLEAQLFGNGSIPLPPGSVLPTQEAMARFGYGAYDLVLVPPVPGRAPCIPDFRVPPETRVVAWFDAGERLAWRSIDQPVLLSSHEFQELSLGIVWGAGEDTALGRVASGEPDSAPWPLDWMRMRGYEREFRSRTALSARLASANAGSAAGALTAGLAAHYAAQHHSSPFENEAQKIEITAASLELLREAALADTPDAFMREVWNGLAGLLVGKRAIEEIYEYVAPIAEKWGPWYELELALAEAELEALEPEAAARRLAVLLASRPEDGPASELLARAHTDQGQYTEAARILRVLLERSHGDPRIERRLGLVLFEAEDPEGRAILERILEGDPDDVEVGSLLHPERDWTAPHR